MQRRSLFLRTFAGAIAGSLASAATVAAAAEAGQSALPASALKEFVPSAEKPLLLNFNENSLGMAASAKEAVAKSMGEAFRYPDAVRSGVIADIAKHFGLASENVSLGNGSSEVIQAVIEAQVHKAQKVGKKVQLLEPVPTFGVAAAYAEALGIPVKDVVLKKDTLSIDVATLKAAAAAFDGVSIVYFCNPNNPTGIITPATEINAWIEEAARTNAPVFFLMDEAYAEFVSDPAFVSAVELVQKGLKNLVVSRTFSKLYALAGLRLGYGLAEKSVAADVNNFESIDNTNVAAAVAASATLRDENYLKLSLEAVNLSRKIVVEAFEELGIAYLPSQANFIFHKVKGAEGEYTKAMAAEHVMVGRPFPPFVEWNRLTLGTPGEMKAFVKVLKKLHKQGLA